MCGIAGYIGQRDIDQQLVDACVGQMSRRGPDATGFYRHSYRPGQNVCLIHSRLSIIDLDSRSNQPYRDATRSFVFNGELYNYLELADSLESAGIHLETRSDTEVFFKILNRWGIEALDRCEGMWSFAYYDEKAGALILSRDRFGEKPLYIYRDVAGIYFGSEVKFIAALSGRRLPVNYNHICRYLVNGYKSLYKSSENFFSGVEEVPASHYLRIKSDGVALTESYWKPVFTPDEALRYEDVVYGTRDRLIESVRMRLRSNVPLAFCMSGGVDSNSLIGIAKKIFNYDVHGFTIINKDERYAEQDLVDYTVKELDIRHTPIELDTANFLENLRELIKYHDAPVYTISYYVHWLLMQQISQSGYKISISGTAADELFSGYYDHHALYLSEIVRDSDLFDDSLANWKTNIGPIIRNPLLQDPECFIKNPSQRGHIYLNAEQFSGFLKNSWYEGFNERQFNAPLMRNRMLNELFHESVPVILHEDDLNAMYFSIENRSPFLDRQLFDYSMQIPTKYLVQNGYAKAVLRDSMRGIVPDRILDCRRKVGFNAPILSLLRHHDSEVKKQILDDSPIYDWVRIDRIQSLLERDTLKNSESKFLFNFICSKIFLEEFGY